MSRTLRRAARRNVVPRSMKAWSGLLDEWSADHINDKTLRDGHSIRGCNGDDCDWCADNRQHRDRARRDAADKQLLE